MTSTLGLYRQLLRVSAVWPSSNRGKIMQEIRAGVPPLISLLCTALSLPHARVHHARWRTAFRTPSMLGPSSVARLRRSRAEFRQNRSETDAVKLQKMLSEASIAAMWRLGA